MIYFENVYYKPLYHNANPNITFEKQDQQKYSFMLFTISLSNGNELVKSRPTIDLIVDSWKHWHEAIYKRVY